MKIKTGSDFSGVGAFDQALARLGYVQDKKFACDMDKYARQTYIHNYGEPFYYPENVYDRAIPTESLDIYMTSPPCQAFSLAGKRKGEEDKRGVLFYNSHEFIKVNNPRYFIFENVKGLLSDDGGKTFQRWIDYLAGKTVNGNPVIFPHEDSVPYHVYYQVLNAKHYGVPQNRERIFIIGVRDDKDNDFSFPKTVPLVKRLKDVLETFETSRFETQEEFKAYMAKYFLSDKIIQTLFHSSSGKDGCFEPAKCCDEEKVSQAVTARYAKMGRQDPYIQVKSATLSGYEVATENDSINFSVPNSETRCGRVGKGVAQTLDTACNQGVIMYDKRRNKEVEIKHEDAFCYGKSAEFGVTFSTGYANTIDCKVKQGVNMDSQIRRLTPRECFRLMDFPDAFTWPVSDSQAYKQAGNSIVVNVLSEIISKLKFE